VWRHLPARPAHHYVRFARAWLRWLRLAMLRQRRRLTAELAAEMSRRKPPLVDEDPLVWKERYVGGPTELATSTAAWRASASSLVC